MKKHTIEDFYKKHGHYGLRRTGREKMFALSMGMEPIADEQYPEVDIAAIPNSMEVSKWHQIENQQQLGSCRGHASTSTNELAIYRETRGRIVQLNRMFSYVAGQHKDGIYDDSGSTMEGGARASMEYGDCLESLWPYTGRYGRGWDDVPQSCFVDAATRKLRHFQVARGYDDMLRWLVHGLGGIMFGTDWNNSWEPDARGVVEKIRRGGGGHALPCLDWDKSFVDAKGRPYLWVPNSWGRDWGKNGACWIAPNAADYICEYGTVLLCSDLDGPDIKPREIWVPGSICA